MCGLCPFWLGDDASQRRKKATFTNASAFVKVAINVVTTLGSVVPQCYFTVIKK